MMAKKDFLFFWNGIYSQWYPSNFVVNGVMYNCCEQYMMAKKAILFGDDDTLEKIMREKSPKKQKELGRQVKNFNSEVWNSLREFIVYEGNLAKFSQNEELKLQLLVDGFGKEFVEASPKDSIWGIGLSEDDERAWDKKTWLGSNLLGNALTKVYKTLANEQNKSVLSGVSVILFNKKNQVLVGVRKGSHGAGMLSVPGGHSEYLESINECCNRELLEEIGVSFDGQYKHIGVSEDVFNKKGEIKHYITLYLAVENIDSDNIKILNLEPHKCEGWNWMDIDDLPDNMFCDTQRVIKEYKNDQLTRQTK